MPANPFILVPYSPNWPREFQQLASQLRKALGPLALRIDHIGSTAVPNLCSKDVIDIQVTVEDVTNPAIVEALTAARFQLRPNVTRDHIPPNQPNHPAPLRDWEKRFFREPPDTRTAHIHVRGINKPNQRYALLFRDYLRAHPDAAEAYARTKQHLAAHLERDQYIDTKDPVCDLILQAAEMWASAWKLPPSDA